MSIETFIKEAGSDVGVGKDEPMLLYGIGKPDWVNVPDHPGLPGGRRTCHALVRGTCKVPGHQDHEGVHYILDGPVWCCECYIGKQFQWYRTPPDGAEYIERLKQVQREQNVQERTQEGPAEEL